MRQSSTATRKFIGAYAAELGGLDRPGDKGPETKVLPLPHDEETQIARHARRLMAQP